MDKIKYFIGHRMLWLLMGLHILNFSIDNPHTLLENSKVDSDFEEVDSFAELVLEDVMHIEDAFPNITLNHLSTKNSPQRKWFGCLSSNLK